MIPPKEHLTQLLLDKFKNEVKQGRGAHQARGKETGTFGEKSFENKSWRGILRAVVGHTNGTKIITFKCCGRHFMKPKNATNHIRRRHGIFVKGQGETLEGLEFETDPRIKIIKIPNKGN